MVHLAELLAKEYRRLHGSLAVIDSYQVRLHLLRDECPRVDRALDVMYRDYDQRYTQYPDVIQALDDIKRGRRMSEFWCDACAAPVGGEDMLYDLSYEGDGHSLVDTFLDYDLDDDGDLLEPEWVSRVTGKCNGPVRVFR